MGNSVIKFGFPEDKPFVGRYDEYLTVMRLQHGDQVNHSFMLWCESSAQLQEAVDAFQNHLFVWQTSVLYFYPMPECFEKLDTNHLPDVARPVRWVEIGEGDHNARLKAGLRVLACCNFREWKYQHRHGRKGERLEVTADFNQFAPYLQFFGEKGQAPLAKG